MWKFDETDKSGTKGLFIVAAFQGSVSSPRLLKELEVKFCLSAGSVFAIFPV